MRDRIDPLIFERAPWLAKDRPDVRAARRILDTTLSYDRTIRIAESLEQNSAAEIMDHMGALLARDVKASGLGNIPRHGPAMIVCNHPTGIADGIILWHLLSGIRPDLYFYANRDILRVMPQLDTIIAPVEWRKDKRSHGKTRETMAFTRAAVDEGRLGVIFPSGRLAKRRGLRLYEREWMASAAMLARKFDLPVIPVNLRARNSALFYLFDLIHPTLRDITLFYETMNKDKQPYVVSVGDPTTPQSLPATSEQGIEMMRKATLALGGSDAPTVSLVRATRRPLLRF